VFTRVTANAKGGIERKFLKSAPAAKRPNFSGFRRPSGGLKMTDMKMQDMKLTDQFAGHLQGMKLQDMKTQDMKLAQKRQTYCITCQ